MNSSKDDLIFKPPTHEKDFHYSVLNLDKSASQYEINERHRALSLIFHPDKQHDDSTKDTALKRFLEIQKAYEVLSDPFLRGVYDTLGEEGLVMKWAAELRSKPPEELRRILERENWNRKRRQLENLVRPRGRLNCGIDASPLFEAYLGSPQDKWHQRLRHRLEDVRLLSAELKHSIQRGLTDSTKLTLAARMSRIGRTTGVNFLGTIRHQYSPRLAFEATCTALHPQVLNLNASYQDDENALSIRTSFVPRTLYPAPPPLIVSLSRRLFRESPTVGNLVFHISRQPVVYLNVLSPTPFDLKNSEPDVPPMDHTNEDLRLNPASMSGFRLGSHYWSYGFILDTLNTKLTGEWGITFSELALRVKLGLEFGLEGLAWVCGGSWANNTTELAATTNLSQNGVTIKFDIAYLQQRLTVPIVLSLEYNFHIAFWTVVVPSTALVLGYQFILKPRHRARRLAYIRAARRALDKENSSARQETESTILMLKESAKKHMLAETSKGGLVIIDAAYGSTETDEKEKDLVVDVTVPVQALVRNSQLYVPGHRTKSGIQGFYDPAPFTSKSLRVRYLFRGRMHYAEIPDYLPVVLPLADHIVE